MSPTAHPDFVLASGSVTGRDHRNVNVPHNNQDSLAVLRTVDSTIAVVTDGCGSGAHSEVGAKIGARLIVEAISRHIRPCYSTNWGWIFQDMLATIQLLARQMGGNFTSVIEDYFLFTIVGVVMRGETATFFAYGDGVVMINGGMHKLGPFPGNQPPYAAYALLGDRTEQHMQSLSYELIGDIDLSKLQNFLIGTDGVSDLAVAYDKKLPGQDKSVGEISQFWSEDQFFDPSKPDLLNRRLRLIARDWPRKDPEMGLLPDDTTMIVGRKE